MNSIVVNFFIVKYLLTTLGYTFMTPQSSTSNLPKKVKFAELHFCGYGNSAFLTV